MNPRPFILAAAVACALAAAASARAEAPDWPRVELPRDAQRFDVGQQITVNGAPMRIQGFVSRSEVADVLAWFRKSLGQPLVENALDGKRILGRLQGEHYLTVQLEAVDAGGRQPGTRGLVAVTHLKAAYQSRDETRDTIERLLSRMPAGSQLMSQMSSEDGGKLSRHLVFFNRQDESVNIERIKALMREDGLSFERATGADDSTAARVPASVANGRTLFFKGQGKEAMAVVARDAQGQTAVVMNTVTVVERFK